MPANVYRFDERWSIPGHAPAAVWDVRWTVTVTKPIIGYLSPRDQSRPRHAVTEPSNPADPVGQAPTERRPMPTSGRVVG